MNIMYICDCCDFYFLNFGNCPRCGSNDVSKANEEPNLMLEEDLYTELIFDEDN